MGDLSEHFSGKSSKYIPVIPVGMRTMLPGTFKEYKIFRTIIGLLMVHVVNNFFRFQYSAKSLFHNKPMLRIISLFRCARMIRDMNIAITLADNNQFHLGQPTTFVTTKKTRTLRVLWDKLLSAYFAFSFKPGKASNPLCPIRTFLATSNLIHRWECIKRLLANGTCSFDFYGRWAVLFQKLISTFRATGFVGGRRISPKRLTADFTYSLFHVDMLSRMEY